MQKVLETVGDGTAFAIPDMENGRDISNNTNVLDGICINRTESQLETAIEFAALHDIQLVQPMNHYSSPRLSITGPDYCIQQQGIVPTENNTYSDAISYSMPSEASFEGVYGGNISLSGRSSRESAPMADGKKRLNSEEVYTSQQSSVAYGYSPIFRMNDFPYQAAVNDLALNSVRTSHGSDDVRRSSGEEFDRMPASSRIHAVPHQSLLPRNLEHPSSRRTITSVVQSDNMHTPYFINQPNINGEILMNSSIQNHPTPSQISQQTSMLPAHLQVNRQQFNLRSIKLQHHGFPPEGSSNSSPMDKEKSIKGRYSPSTKRLSSDGTNPGNSTLPPQIDFTSGHFFQIPGNTINPTVDHGSPDVWTRPVGIVNRYSTQPSSQNMTRKDVSGPNILGHERQTARQSCYNSPCSKDKFQCVDCLKKNPPKECLYMRTESTGEGRCRRCYEKFKKNLKADTPPSFSYDPNLSGLDAALEYCYAPWPPLRLTNNQEDDWEQCNDAEAEWVERFITAAVQPYEINMDDTSDESLRQWLVDQQTIFNKSPYEKTGGHWFTNKWVNHRFVMLFYAVLNLHRGGRRPYPQGGDNGGYGKIDATMTCSARLKMIEGMLRKDKRIVINVIEGQHVCALAENPRGVMKRKSSNKSTNMKKAEAQEYAKTMKEREKEQDKLAMTSIDSNQVEDDKFVDVGLGPSRKRKRGVTQTLTDPSPCPTKSSSHVQDQASGALKRTSPRSKAHVNDNIFD